MVHSKNHHQEDGHLELLSVSDTDTGWDIEVSKD